MRTPQWVRMCVSTAREACAERPDRVLLSAKGHYQAPESVEPAPVLAHYF